MAGLCSTHLLSLTLLVAALLSNGEVLRFDLEREMSKEYNLSHLQQHDRLRNIRHIQPYSNNGAVNLPVEGSFDTGLYYTRIQLGSPPKEFCVQIDTGSDGLWVNCASCRDCQHESLLEAQPAFFDPSTSTTSGFISCSDDKICTGDGSGCSAQNHYTHYYHYGGGYWALVDYVYDVIHLEKSSGTSAINTSTQIIFGCATQRQGAESLNAPIDGIFGLGVQQISTINQLSANGVMPPVFSHCLKRSGGGTLVLGQVEEQNIVYTPIVGGPNYNVELQSIYVNGQQVPIDPQAFGTNNGGTIFDSGTIMAHIVSEAHDPLINAINQVVLTYANVLMGDIQCYASTTRVFSIFPILRFNFAGGASMTLRPIDYLIRQDSVDGAGHWCLGLLKSERVSVLGDLILKDKIVVYDLLNQQIGWTDYDFWVNFHFWSDFTRYELGC
ncbi:unnamed protein product [Cuscuta epithymum]|uniref:Peptidase A1 domain-containing protein n=1 Tax=Cuscuta epithymum TaxID=186058 RepID=A0AAV0FXJ2_9ASTE|nr:unnamed protein product [Cuscuta epithymum]